MRIKESQLKEWVDELTFKRAKQYYSEGYVQDLETKIVESPIFKKEITLYINSKVISFNAFNIYQVKVEWDSITNSTECKCSCDEQEYKIRQYGPCKHVVAVLLKYIYETQNKIYNETESTEIDELLEELKAISQFDDEYKRDLNLEIKFIKENHLLRPAVELKIGLEKTYVVRNMRSFLTTLLRGDSLQFGKNFTYNSAIHKFNDIDEKIMEMFLEVREIDGEHIHSYDYYSNYREAPFGGKSIFLTDKLTYKFFNLVKERTIDAVIQGVEYNGITIIEGTMPLKFQLGMNENNIELSQLSEFPKPIDKNFKVFWYDGMVYLPPKEQIEMYVPIYNMLTRKRSKKMTFSKREGEKVASYLLPMLKRVSKDIIFDKNTEETFYEAPLAIRTYLDREDKVIIAEIKFSYNDLEINPLKEITAQRDNAILIRDIIKEENCSKVLISFGFEKENQRYVMKEEKSIVSFIKDGVNKLQDLGEVYYSNSFKEIRIYGKSNFKGGIKLNDQDFLEFSFDIEGVDRTELKNIFNALREKKKYYRLKEGGFVSLEDESIKSIGEMIDYLDIKDKDLSKDSILLSKYNALYLDSKIKDKDMEYIQRSRNFLELTDNIRNVKDLDYSLPKHLDSIMRNYQKIGFKWFKTLAAYGFGGILADEMGLGKTLETIAFLASEKGGTPSIVVAPTSLVYNWQSEIERFAPELKTLVISGSKKKREELRSEVENSDVIITSYPLIRRDIEEYKDINFNYCILDEAQQIKNPSSLNASSVKEIKAKGYFALTGTPIENSLTELWSIFDFIMPGYLLTHHKFSKIYETPIVRDNDNKALEELNRHIKPFILRRLKKDVLKELPPKIEHKLVVEMTEEQKKLYAAYLSEAKNEVDAEIRDNGFHKSKLKILAILTRLRQICCDPSVFIEEYSGESGKLTALDELLEETIGEGHKVLLFSQFTSVLKNIAKRLDKGNISYMYLDGSTKSEERMGMVTEFNEGDSKIFLISLKAGGTGLNLTGADVVIHFDPWWNPAVEEQATDRAHRIGQDKTVEVIKLLAKGTIEEKIYKLQQKKKEMIQNVMQEDINEENFITKMSQEDLESLFA